MVCIDIPMPSKCGDCPLLEVIVESDDTELGMCAVTNAAITDRTKKYNFCPLTEPKGE